MDLQQKWLLLCRCDTCKSMITSEVITESLNQQGDSSLGSSVVVKCPNCYTRIHHDPQYVCGDPHNIALIGHWDGWQPFSTLVKHSCGTYVHMHLVIS